MYSLNRFKTALICSLLASMLAPPHPEAQTIQASPAPGQPSAYLARVRAAVAGSATTPILTTAIRPGSWLESRLPAPGNSLPAQAVQASLILTSVDLNAAQLDREKLRILGTRLNTELKQNPAATIATLRDYQSRLGSDSPSAQMVLLQIARQLPLPNAAVKIFARETLEGLRIPALAGNQAPPPSHQRVFGAAHLLFLAGGATVNEGLELTSSLMNRCRTSPRLMDGLATHYVTRFPAQRAALFRAVKTAGLRVPDVGR